MCSFIFFKKYIKIFLYLFTLFILYNNLIFAGSIIKNQDSFIYKNDYGEIAKDMWVWIDTNNDGIAECFRFDIEGHIAINYKDRYGRETNSKGQFIEDGVVVKKLVSSGEILKNKKNSKNPIMNFLDNITKSKRETKKELKKIEYETNGIEETINKKIIINKSIKEDIDILDGKKSDSGVINSNSNKQNISDNIKDREIVAGKDFRRFISSKNMCDISVKEVYVYGGNKWENVLVLNGNGASVKFLTENNNYIRFEIADENNNDAVEMSLDIYLDGELVGSFDNFVKDDSQIIEEYLENVKTIELKLNIKSENKSRKVYIKNGRFKKINIKY